ncbi:hypothetical protein B0O99DRAFT_689550 [Bisporella sp. PMI_857]|nr:hypothetical protein B0O99DRAFT_689550 [Bisporella sp. PMI_857]
MPLDSMTDLVSSAKYIFNARRLKADGRSSAALSGDMIHRTKSYSNGVAADNLLDAKDKPFLFLGRNKLGAQYFDNTETWFEYQADQRDLGRTCSRSIDLPNSSSQPPSLYSGRINNKAILKGRKRDKLWSVSALILSDIRSTLRSTLRSTIVWGMDVFEWGLWSYLYAHL